jgi:hypothetical protein
MTGNVIIEVCRDGWTGKLQMSISLLDEDGAGNGYRLAGPKFNGSGQPLLIAKIDERAAQEIRRQIDEAFPVVAP